jgi:sugar phosphate isomerase/epimerase
MIRDTGVKLGFSLNKPGWCSPDDAGAFLDFLADAGVGAVELTLSSSGAFERKMAKVALARGLRITFHMAWDGEAVWGWYRGWNTEAGRTGFDRLLTMLDGWAERQGEPVLVVIHPFDDGCNREHGFATTVVFCRRLVERTTAQNRRVQWVIENMPHDPNVPSRPGDRVEEIDEIVMGVPGLGICWDVGHWYLTRAIDPTWSGPLTDYFVAHVAHTHVHDYTQEQGDHLPPGRRIVPLAASLHRLRTTGYDGWLTLELDHNKALRFGKPQDVVRDALAVVRQAWSGT